MTSGYDVPPLGLASGQFYSIHVTSVVAICTSFVCATLVLVYSFKHHKSITFFTWNKSERLVVYIAGCDVVFNVIHSSDHLQMLITKDHVLPRAVCKFHGFMDLVISFGQVCLVLFVALNIFCLMFLHKNISLGKRDWKLLVPSTVLPFLIAVGCLAADKFGPSGAFCFFDSVSARMVNVFLTTIPVCLVLVNNAILYGLTWYKIKTDVRRLSVSLGGPTASTRRTHRSAKNMFLFLIAFCVQWWGIAVYGVWLLFDQAPVTLFIVNTVFLNSGGVWNGMVYLVIRRRRHTTLPKTQKSPAKINRPQADDK